MATTKRWKRHDSTAWRGGRIRRRRRGIAWIPLPKGPISRALLLVAILAFGAFAAWYLLGRGGERFAVLGIVGGAEGPTYQSSIADVGRPLAVATSPDGRLIYAGESEGRHAVRIFDREGREVGSIGPPEWAPGWVPISIAVARTGEVYVADGIWGGVHVFSAEGEFLRTLPPPEGVDEWFPTALAFDDAGNLYVIERYESTSEIHHRVLVFSAEDELLRQFGETGSGQGELNYPGGIAVDDQGRIYVTNILAGVDVFTSEGAFITRLGSPGADTGVGLGRGLAIDENGRLYVVDVTGQQVAVYDTTSEGFPFLYYFGSFGLGNGEFRFPAGITVDATGRIYVADRENDRVQEWS